MPLVLNKNLGCYERLINDGIKVYSNIENSNENIYKIGILNLMPTKIETEYQLLRILGKSEFLLDIKFLYTKSYESKNVSIEYLRKNYMTIDDLGNEKFDGFIITGAPVETLDFEEVAYWNELVKIMDYVDKNSKTIVYICWGAQAGLYYHYGVPKYPLNKKMFGVFSHKVLNDEFLLFDGIKELFFVPHSRHTEIKKEDIENVEELVMLAISEEAGVHVVADKSKKHIFIIGHGEYDKYTLKNEYERDINNGVDIDLPKNYFINDNPTNEPIVSWRDSGEKLYLNWVKYFVV
ncbi:MAG: homoserine O-succinyltransferase [Clostridiales bacterium]|nr:homoserine O-succinyltransferase [Clostridiales bacterium]